MIFKIWTDCCNIQIFYIVHKNNGMRVSHRYTGHMIDFSFYLNRYVDNRTFFYCNRNFFWFKNRRTHIYLNTCNLSILYLQPKIFDSC